MRYFKKHNPSQAILGSNGKYIAFPDFHNGFGGYATEDPALIAEFLLAIRKNKGGIQEVSEAEFESLKKKEPSSNRPPGDEIKFKWNQFERGQGRQPAAAARGEPPPLTRVNREESLLLPSEAARPTGFKPKSVVR